MKRDMFSDHQMRTGGHQMGSITALPKNPSSLALSQSRAKYTNAANGDQQRMFTLWGYVRRFQSRGDHMQGRDAPSRLGGRGDLLRHGQKFSAASFAPDVISPRPHDAALHEKQASGEDLAEHLRSETGLPPRSAASHPTCELVNRPSLVSQLPRREDGNLVAGYQREEQRVIGISS
jgi:hypothetical protein